MNGAIEASSSRSLKPLDRESWRSFDLAIILILASISVYNFVRRGPTAFEWPGSDMATFFERQADPSFLPNDYFTNSVAQPNPRYIFGYLIIGLAKLFGTDWYGIYFALRVLMTCTLPMLWYLALVGLIKDRLTDDRMRWIARLVLALAIMLVMRRDVSNWFSIAWWPPYFLYVGAHPFALYLGLVGIVLATFGTGIVRHLSLVVWFAASLIHPAIGLFVMVFYWLATFELGNWREFLVQAFIAVALPFAILAIAFRPEKPLSAAEFVEAYVITTHPFHYHLAEFATLTKHPWWVSFSLVVSLMGLVGIIAALRRNRPLSSLSVLFMLSYFGCIAIQYLGTEVWPSKTIAALGPSRFTFLGYYMLALLVALITCDLWPARWASTSVIRRTVSPWLERLRPVHVAIVTMLAVVALTVLLKDDLQGEVRAHYGGFYEWVGQNTQPDDVFATPFNEPLHRELPVIGRRAVVASQCFPFREDAIREHVERLTLVYGTNEQLARTAGKDQIRRRMTFYRALGPEDFLRIANQLRLDYVVVEASYRSQFDGYPVRYEDDSVAVYDVASFRDN